MLKSSGEKSPQGATKGAETPKKEDTMEKYIKGLSPAARERFERDRRRRKAKAAQAKAIKAKAARAEAKAKAKAEAAQAEVEAFMAEIAQAAKAAARRVVRHRRNAEIRAAKAEAREGIKTSRREAAQTRAEAKAAEAQLRANDRALGVVTLPARGWVARCVSTTPQAGVGGLGMAQAIADGVGMVLRAEAAAAEVREFLAEVRAAVAQALKAALRAHRANRRAEAKAQADKASAAKAKAACFRGTRLGRPMEFISPAKADRTRFLTDAGYTREEAQNLAKVRKAAAAKVKAEREALAQARAELKALRAIEAQSRRQAMEALAGLRNAVRRALRARNGFEMNAAGLVTAIKSVRSLGLEPRGAVLSEIVLLGYGDLVA